MGAIDYFKKIKIEIQIKLVNGQAMCKFMITALGPLGLYRHVLVDPSQYFASNSFARFWDTLGIKRHVKTGSYP
jgi:hypothetical protein